jgi:tryptophan synthase beta chain
MSYVLQDADGQIIDAHSVSAGLDYPGVGPELSALKDSGRMELASATDEEAVEAVRTMARAEGIICALETAHAVHAAVELAKTLDKGSVMLINVSGRGDKDLGTLEKELKP